MASRTPTEDEVIALLRAEGKRITQAKRAVIRSLLDAADHRTVEEITVSAQAVAPDVSLSTVYRILEELEDFAVVDHTHNGHQAATYHLAGRDHGHVTCQRCGTTFEVSTEVFDLFSRELRRTTGFQIDPHHVALSGLCEECRSGD
jgi:Fur family ferric uptake transcriptional regulator